MIEKIPKQNTWGQCLEKINELVDAVNVLQLAKDAMFYAIRDIQNRITALDNPTYHEAEPEPADNSEKANCQENVQDKFAEQRRWIGKLCWVWDDDDDERTWAILKEIIEDDDDRPFKCFARWKHCEPVKPDDDIIYKGE